MKKVILGILIGLSLSAISVVALNLCNAKDIEYNASDINWDVDTVSDALNDLYKSKGSNTNDSCNNVAEPNLGNEEKIIPVIIDDNGTVTKVNKNNPNWYNYCEKKWANAVILNDSVPIPNDNQAIEMINIESMFVWIPKYKYKLWNVNSTGKDSIEQKHSIDIVFDTTNTIEKNGVSCETPMESGNIGNCSNGEYMTHPAFISFDVDGFWVGKFETGYKNATTTAQAQVSSNDPSYIVVKPNAFSWRNNPVKNMFEAAYDYERDLDSHMMKNTEWGAVAYLSHSKYGIDREININNKSSYKTGYSALPSTNQQTFPGITGDDNSYNQQWNTNVGYIASTTGNITGVYDMSGGAFDTMASYTFGKYGNSGFNSTLLNDMYNDDYYDVYNANSTGDSYQYMILGDATGEMGPFRQYVTGGSSNDFHNGWYGDIAYFIDSSNSWFRRGGPYTDGSNGGQFEFNRHSGALEASNGFRIVLAGENKHPTN